MKFSAYTDKQTGVHGISVKSCGHIFADNGRSINLPNGRDDWALIYIVKGTEKFFLQNEVQATEGSFLILRPYERHAHICVSKKSEFYYIHFYAPDDFDTLALESSKIYDKEYSVKISMIFEEIIKEVQLKLPSYEKIAVYKLLELITLLNRKVISSNTYSREYMDKIAFVIENMHREYASNYGLSDYAGMCHMSKYHFLRIFRSVTGSTPIEYRNEIRLSHAKELLSETTLTVGEICSMLGYSSSVYFCDVFKKNTGVSPSVFRKSSR